MLSVIPKTGVLVRKEESGIPILPTGETVPNSSYYRKRIKDGDLIVVTPKKQTSGAKK